MHFLFLFISVTCGFGYTWRDEREYCTKNSGMKSLFLLYVVYACGLFRKKTSNIFESSLDNNIFTKSSNKVLDGTPWKVYRHFYDWTSRSSSLMLPYAGESTYIYNLSPGFSQYPCVICFGNRQQQRLSIHIIIHQRQIILFQCLERECYWHLVYLSLELYCSDRVTYIDLGLRYFL